MVTGNQTVTERIKCDSRVTGGCDTLVSPALFFDRYDSPCDCVVHRFPSYPSTVTATVTIDSLFIGSFGEEHHGQPALRAFVGRIEGALSVVRVLHWHGLRYL